MSNFSKYRILIFSENPDTLVPFYQDVLGFELLEKLDIPGDYGYMFRVVGDLNVWLGRHSEIKGKVKEPVRHLFNLYPEDGVIAWYEKLKQHPEATIIAEPFKAPFSTPDNEVWFCTFLDPEGNGWQMVGKK